MLKEAIVDYLHQFLSLYCETPDVSQLTLSLWAGDVILQDLIMKTTALQTHNVPITILAGRVGRLSIKIPWASIFRNPVEIFIHNCYILLNPSYKIYDKETEEAFALTLKQNLVQKIEDAYKDFATKNSTDHQGGGTYLERCLMQIARNIQIKLESIHICYEDRRIGKPLESFSFGIVLNNFHIQTTNKDWIPTYISENVETSYKLGIIEDFAFYWNQTSTLTSDDVQLSRNELLDLLKEFVPPNDDTTSKLKYVETKIILTPSPTSTHFKFPIFRIETVVSELGLALSQKQFHDLLTIAETIETISRSQKYKKFKPKNLNEYSGNYKRWWKFAIDCVKEDNWKRRTHYNWESISKHRALVKSYMDAYHKKITMKKPTKEVDDKVNELEKSLDIFNIILARKMIRLSQLRLEKIETAKKGWFSWLTSNKTLTPEELTKIFTDTWTPEEKIQLNESIDFKQSEPPIPYPINYESVQIKFCVKKIHFVLSTSDFSMTPPEYTILRLSIMNFEKWITVRPVKNGLKIEVTLENIEARGVEDEQLIMMPTNSEFPNFFQFIYENRPLNLNADRRVQLKLLRLFCVYNYKTWQELLNLFAVENVVDATEISDMAVTKLENIKEFSTTSFRRLVSSKTELDVNIDLVAPYIVIPDHGELKPDSNVLVIDMGELHIRSQPKMLNSDGTLSTFDIFTVVLQDFRVFIAVPGEDYFYKLYVTKTNYLLKYKQMTGVIVKYSVIRKGKVLTSFKLDVDLPVVDISISQKRLVPFLSLLLHLPVSPIVNAVSTKPSKSALFANRKAVHRLLSYINMEEEQTDITKNVNDFFKLSLDVRVNSIKIRANHEADNLFILELLSLTLTLKNIDFVNEIIQIDIGGMTVLSIEGGQSNNKVARYLVKHPPDKDHDGPLVAIKVNAAPGTCPSTRVPMIGRLVTLNVPKKLDVMFHHQVLASLILFIDGVISNNTLVMLTVELLNESSPCLSRTDVKLRVNFTMEFLTILLCTSGKNLMRFHVKKINGKYEETFDMGVLVLQLPHISAFNVDPDCRHHKLLSIDSQKSEVLKFIIAMYEEDLSKSGSEVKNPNVKLNLTVGTIYAIILPTLISYIKAIVVQLQLDTRRPKEDVQKQVESNEEEDLQKILFDIQIEAPRLIFPRDVNSPEGICINLGKLSVQNKFREMSVDGSKRKRMAVMNEISFNLISAYVSRVYLNLDHQQQQPSLPVQVFILNPLSFRCTAHWSLSPWCSSIPHLKFVGHLENNVVRINKEDYRACMAVLKAIFEGLRITGESGSESPTTIHSTLIPNQQQQNFHCELNMNRLTLILYRGTLPLTDKQGVVLRNEAETLATFIFYDIKGSCSTWTNSDVIAVLTVADIILRDTRYIPGAPSYKTILVRNEPNPVQGQSSGQGGSSLNSAPHYKITYKDGTIRQATESNLHMELPPLSVNLFSEFLAEIYKFFDQTS